MTMEKKIFRSLLTLIFIDQTYITFTFPLITLIFFDPQSRLFPSDISYAARSMWYGMCVALPSFINIFFAPTLSALSDEFGRKKILLIEIASAFVFTSLVGIGIYTGKLSLVFLGFIIKGAFARTNPTALAIIGDTATREKKILYMGYLQFAISVGASIGPILGGYFATRFLFSHFNFSLPFFIAALLALANIFLTAKLMQETLRKKIVTSNRLNIAAIKSVMMRPGVLNISLLLLLIQLSWSTYYQFIPPILKTMYQFDAHTLGWFIGMIAVWLAFTTSIVIKILDNFMSVKQMLSLSIYLVLLGFIITLLGCSHLLSAGSLLIWAGAIPIAAGDVLAYSCLTALYSNVVTHEEQGKVMGIGFFIVASAWAATGFIGGFLMSITPLLPLMVAPLSIIASLFLLSSKFGEKLVKEQSINSIEAQPSY